MNSLSYHFDGTCFPELMNWALIVLYKRYFHQDEKNTKIQELNSSLIMIWPLKEMEEHSNHFSININNVIHKVREIKSNTFTKPLSWIKQQNTHSFACVHKTKKYRETVLTRKQKKKKKDLKTMINYIGQSKKSQ